jgi:hypothetical protein
VTAKKNAVPRHLDLVTEVARSSKNVARGSAVMWLAMYRPIWIASARSVTVLNDGCLSLFAFSKMSRELASKLAGQ